MSDTIFYIDDSGRKHAQRILAMLDPKRDGVVYSVIAEFANLQLPGRYRDVTPLREGGDCGPSGPSNKVKTSPTSAA